MGWLFLFIAGLFEIGWPLGFKMSQESSQKWVWLVFSTVSMALSLYFLWLSQKYISIGTAYAVWTGIGAVGAFVLGILYFKDPVTFFRILSVTFIIIGIIGLKLSSG